jgi:hypothetical protein
MFRATWLENKNLKQVGAHVPLVALRQYLGNKLTNNFGLNLILIINYFC